jgi:hypothetical protein
MSRYYEFDIAIDDYRPSREDAIKRAVEALDFGPDATEPHDWERWTESLHITGRRSLCNGQPEEEFVDAVAAAVWKANRSPCRIEVQATRLEDLPSNIHDRGADEYEEWKSKQPRKGRRSGSPRPVEPRTG